VTPAMIAALSQNRAQATGFFEFQLPSGTKRLMLGSGEVTSGGNTFKGFDSTFGSVTAGDGVREDMTGEAPNTSISIAVSPDAVKADIAGENAQLSPVKIYLAALELDANQRLVAIPDPELLASGFIDQAIIGLDKTRDEIDYTIISAFDYFFEDSEGQRLSPAFHKAVWPGELGLDNVTGITRKIYWGTYGPGGQGGGIGAHLRSGGSLWGYRPDMVSV
jgi:hypothetical protein